MTRITRCLGGLVGDREVPGCGATLSECTRGECCGSCIFEVDDAEEPT